MAGDTALRVRMRTPPYPGAQMVALFAARNAGIKVPEEAIEKGKAYMLTCQDSNGGFGYTGASGANLPRSAIGSLVLSLAKDTESDAYRNSVEYLKKNVKFGDQGHKFYSLYYTSQAIFRTNPAFWNTWNSTKFQTPASKPGGKTDRGTEITERPSPPRRGGGARSSR